MSARRSTADWFGVLERTGKVRPSDLDGLTQPTLVVNSVGDLIKS
jgi:hypothetical protein